MKKPKITIKPHKNKKATRKQNSLPVAHNAPLDFQWPQLRRLEGEVIDHHLGPYAMQELPPEVIDSALADFFPEDLSEGVDRDVLFKNLFIPWFLFNWVPDDDFGVRRFDPDRTVAYNYLKIHGNRLNSQQKLFIEAMDQTFYSFYSVLEVEKEKSLTVKDFLLGTTHTVKERQGTHYLTKGNIVFSRILTLNGQSIFIGMAPFSLPVTYHIQILDFKNWLASTNKKVVLNAHVLRNQVSQTLLDYFFEVVSVAIDQPMPVLKNSDDEFIVYCKSYFKLMVTPEEALNCLLPMTLSDDPDEFLEDATRSKSGQIKRLEFSWLTKGNKIHKSWGNTILGEITLEPGKLTLETNSRERAERGKYLFSKYLEDAIAFQKTSIETPEQAMKSLPKPNSQEDQESQQFLDSPEMQEYFKEEAKKHWKNWLDFSIPALDDKTPREAAKTENGQERLEALLWEYECRDLEEATNLYKADIPYLRRELGLSQA